MLEEPNRIDMIGVTPDGRIMLVITDAGITTDPDRRFALFLANIETCLAYATSDRLAKDHPGKSLADVRIRLMCTNPPTEQMQQLTSVSPANQKDHQIPISIEVVPFG